MAIRVGVDLAAITTVAETLEGPNRDRYLARIFTAGEVEDCTVSGRVSAERLATRFAAKEAMIKLLATDEGLSWREIEVSSEASGSVRLVLHGRASALAADSGIVDLALSLSHEDGMAVAVAVAEVRAATDRSGTAPD
jgi:holo-[acyl-carrier protein] synthase